MPHEGGHDVFGDVDAALAAFEHLPIVALVTDGPELRTVAYNAAARAISGDRFVHGQPLGELFTVEVVGQGWLDTYAAPTVTGETVRRDEHRVQYHQPDGSVLEVYLDVVVLPRRGPDGRPRGTIAVAHDVTDRVAERVATERELDELRDRYAAAHGATRAMQRALLPDTVPVLPGADIAARYVLAADEQVAGGDWFDVVPRSDGTVLLVVGDVVGHGTTASVAMGQLRSVLLAQLRAGAGVSEAVTFLDGFAETVPAARRATVCVVSVDTATGAVAYCTAGHPPPLVVGGDDEATRYLAPSGAGPLATGASFEVVAAELRTGEAIVLYSDGIVERPGVGPASAVVELSTTASNAYRNVVMPSGASASPAERICSLTIELLTRATGHSDDITILALQRRPPVPGLALDADVGLAAVPRCRDALRTWLGATGVGPEDAELLVHATNELVANVIDHAHAELPAPPFRVTATLDDAGTVTVEVVDRGTWKAPMLARGRGRGLALARQLVDHLEVDHAPTGTTARIRHTVARRAGLLDHTPGAAAVGREQFDVWARTGPDPTVFVTGPLDTVTVTEAAAFAHLALTEAADVLTVDLSGVSLLASAGVALLFDLAEHAGAGGLRLDLVAPGGSPAQHVLALVGLGHRDA